jgi:glycosyltransferase involved in cell wall biosynthesis
MPVPHILHVIDSLAPGGAERMVIAIANATDKTRYKVSICVTHSDITLANELVPSVSLFKLGRRKKIEVEKFMILAKFCKEGKVDLLQVHMRSSFLFISTLMCVGLLPKLPVIFTDHDGDVELNNHIPWGVQICLKVLKPYFVGVCPDLTLAAIKAGVSPEKSCTIRNAINFSSYDHSYYSSQKQGDVDQLERPVGIMVANIRPTKDHQFLLKALSELKEDKWTFLLVGGENDVEYLSRVKQNIRDLDLESRVRFLGARVDIPALLKLADFGVLSSKSESGPLVLLEYIAAGLPFVSTKVGLIGKTLCDLGVPGLMDKNDFDRFVQAISELLHLSLEERLRRADLARELVSPQFDIQMIIPLWYAVYEKALKRPE